MTPALATAEKNIKNAAAKLRNEKFPLTFRPAMSYRYLILVISQ